MNSDRQIPRTLRLLSFFFALPLIAGLAGCGSNSATVGSTQKTLATLTVSSSSTSVAVGATEQLTLTGKYSDGSTADVTSTATWTSSSTTVATVSAAGVATGVAAGSAMITGSLSGVTGTMALTVTAGTKTLTSIAVTPAAPSIAVGATEQFLATATYSDGSMANVSSTVSWTSSSAATATVSATGLATGVAAGSATVTASSGGMSGSATLTITAAAKTLTSIAVTPATPSAAIGGTEQFIATATYSDGSAANVSSMASWTSSNPAIATVNASSGLATGVAAGSSTITATLNGMSGAATLTVTPKTVTSIAVSPANGSASVDGMQQFTATATYNDGTTANVSSMTTWTSSSPAVATVNASSGLATGVTAGSSTITATLSGMSGTAMLTITAQPVTSLAITPNPASLAIGGMQQFTATATYGDGTTGNVSSTATWSAGNSGVATIGATGLATGVAEGSTTITATLSGTTGSAPLTVSGVDIPTFHVDQNRSGLNAGEQSLTPTNVTSSKFGKLFSYLVDGYVYGEPLIMSNVTVGGAAHNVLYVATEYDSVYAFDADSGNGTPLWKTSLLQSKEAPISGTDIQPFVGVTSTPVIDPKTNTMYVVSEQKATNGAGTFRLNALDITTGLQKTGSPVTINATIAGTNSQANADGIITLTTSCIQRAALLLANGQIYIGFGSCHNGWLLEYDAQTLTQTAMFNASPNQNGEGTYQGAGGIWMGGGGPDADSAGNVYVTTGNGPWDGQTSWGDSVLKFPPPSGTATTTPAKSTSPPLQVADYFTTADYHFDNCDDEDMSAGGLLLIPGTTEALAAGKPGELFLVNETNLGHVGGATQALWFDSDLTPPGPTHTDTCQDTETGTTVSAQENESQIYGTAAYFNGSVYLGVVPETTGIPAPVRQFAYSSGKLTPGNYTSQSVGESSYGTTPFISANGTSDGIMWMIDHGIPLDETGSTDATLRAYNAADLSSPELYDSSQNAADTPGYGIKFTSPIVANGKVYISTGHDPITAANPQGEIDVYGLK